MSRTQKPKEKQPDYTGCKTCVYYTSGSNGSHPQCNFLYYTGQLRGCPAGAGCTRREPRQTRIRTDSTRYAPPDTLTIDRRIRADWELEKEQAARHFERMTARQQRKENAPC